MVKYLFNNKNKKAQIFSLDLIIAVIIFITVIIFISATLDYSNRKINIQENVNDIDFVAENAISSLVENEGNPSNWSLINVNDFNETNVLSLGFGKSLNFNKDDSSVKSKSMSLNKNDYLNLDSVKIDRLNTLNATKYTEIKNILGIKGSGYEFELIIKNWNGNSYDTKYDIGKFSNNNVDFIVKKSRFSLIENNITLVELKIWKQ